MARQAKLTSALVKTIMNTVYPQVLRHRASSWQLGREYYLSQRQSHAPSAPHFDNNDGPKDYPRKALDDSVQRIIEPAIEQNTVSTKTISLQADDIVRQSESAAHDAVLYMSAIDRDLSVRWARYDPTPPTCKFCTLLISRGYVYHSADKESASFSAHPKDSCVPVLEFDGKRDPAVTKQIAAALEQYKKDKAAQGKKTPVPSAPDKTKLEAQLKLAKAARATMSPKAQEFQDKLIQKLEGKIAKA